jgi:hypothetical protein
MDYESKKTDQFERVIATHKFGSVNPQTKDTCSLAAANIDITFRHHHDSLGTPHAIFGIKRESKDFCRMRWLVPALHRRISGATADGNPEFGLKS